MLDKRPAGEPGHVPRTTSRLTGPGGTGLARKAAVALAVMSASLVAAPSAHAADCSPGSYPPAQCSALVSSTVVPEGGTVTVFGPGFAPRSPVSIDILSHVVHLRTVKANERGWVGARVRIPREVEEGAHTLMLTGKNPDGSARRLSAAILVIEPRYGGGAPRQSGSDEHREAGMLASTGPSGATTELGAAGGILLGAGGLTLHLVRRRRRSRAS